MGMTEEQWNQFHLFLLDFYTIRNLDRMQNYVLEQLEKMIPHKRSFFDLGSVKENTIHFFHPVSLNIPEQSLKAYYAEYQQRDYAIWNFSTREPMVYLDSALLPKASREQSPIYQEWMKPLDAYYGLGCTIVKENFYGSITLFRSESEGDFTGSEYLLLKNLNLHLSSHFYTLFPTGIHESNLLDEDTQFDRVFHLSPRETEITKLVSQGATNAEIADALCISETTVKKHMSHIFEKTHVSNRGQLFVKLKDYF